MTEVSIILLSGCNFNAAEFSNSVLKLMKDMAPHTSPWFSEFTTFYKHLRSFIHSFIHHHAQPYSFWIHSSSRFAQNCGNLSINFSKMLAQNCGLLGLPYMYICILILRSLFLFSKVCLSIHSFSRFAPLLWYY